MPPLRQKAIKRGEAPPVPFFSSKCQLSFSFYLLWSFSIAFKIYQDFIDTILWKDWPNRIYSDISGSITPCHLFLTWHSEPYAYFGPNLFFPSLFSIIILCVAMFLLKWSIISSFRKFYTFLLYIFVYISPSNPYYIPQFPSSEIFIIFQVSA